MKNVTAILLFSIMSFLHAQGQVVTSYSYDSTRQLTELNVPVYGEANPWISANGMHLYYTSADSSGNIGLMYTSKKSINALFQRPVPVPLNLFIVNSVYHSCWFSDDELDLYVSLDNFLIYSHRDSATDSFVDVSSIDLSLSQTPSVIAGVSLNKNQNSMFISLPDSGGSTLNEFSKVSTGKFKFRRRIYLPAGFTSAAGELSRDELTFFVSASRKNSRILIYQLDRKDTASAFDSTSFKEVNGINDTSKDNTMPTMSNNLDWVVFAKNDTGILGSSLYLAKNKAITYSINNEVPQEIPLALYPDPASTELNFEFKGELNNALALSVYSISGDLVYSQNIPSFSKSIKINTEAFKSGMYFYKFIENSNGAFKMSTGKFVVEH